MRNLSISLSTILLVVSLLGTGCTSKSAESADVNPVLAPHRTDIYFLVDRPTGLVAYIPEGSVVVSIKVNSNIAKPYIEVPKKVYKHDPMGLSGKDHIGIAWGFGGTLYVKDLEQLKGLILVK